MFDASATTDATAITRITVNGGKPVCNKLHQSSYAADVLEEAGLTCGFEGPYTLNITFNEKPAANPRIRANPVLDSITLDFGRGNQHVAVTLPHEEGRDFHEMMGDLMKLRADRKWLTRHPKPVIDRANDAQTYLKNDGSAMLQASLAEQGVTITPRTGALLFGLITESFEKLNAAGASR